MVGREHELALLLERWAQAQGGEGQAVLLVGEAGIGKSRLVRALLDACAEQPHWRVRWQCSPYHTGSALWPVIQRLSRSAGLQVQDSTDAALDKLETLTGRDPEAKALYATLLGLNGSQRYGPLDDDAADAARAHDGVAGRATAREGRGGPAAADGRGRALDRSDDAGAGRGLPGADRSRAHAA